jgi:AcrR family transcriptional regulator
VPHANPERRQALADAAIALLASAGAHGLTHRAAENAAGLPSGTASNYFRSRAALFVAAAERITELHYADTNQAAQEYQDALAAGNGQPSASPPASPAEVAAELIAGGLAAAVTLQRERHLAVLELLLEARRRPELAVALTGLQESATSFTAGLHARLGLPIPASAVPVLLGLYEGALFTLLTAPPGPAAERSARALAHAMVHGALPDWPAPDCPFRQAG